MRIRRKRTQSLIDTNGLVRRQRRSQPPGLSVNLVEIQVLKSRTHRRKTRKKIQSREELVGHLGRARPEGRRQKVKGATEVEAAEAAGPYVKQQAKERGLWRAGARDPRLQPLVAALYIFVHRPSPRESGNKFQVDGDGQCVHWNRSGLAIQSIQENGTWARSDGNRERSARRILV